MLAGFALAAWISIGSFFVDTSEEREAALPVSLLIGSALTAATLAILTRIGVVDAALGFVTGVSVGALWLRRSVVRRMIADVVAEFGLAVRHSRALRELVVPVAALLWLYAIAPPRDGDVMRYHLAHIRQIISDGRWESIADYHYALPFGWTLNYLPFERIGLPQAASLVNAGLWVLLLGGLLRATRGAITDSAEGRTGGSVSTPPTTTATPTTSYTPATSTTPTVSSRQTASTKPTASPTRIPSTNPTTSAPLTNSAYATLPAPVCLAFLIHPFVIRTFASAMVDGYGAFVVYAIALLLLKASSPGLSSSQEPQNKGDRWSHRSRDAALLGFVCWIGAQSRYQLVAAAVAGSFVFTIIAFRARSARALRHFGIGAIAALVLSAPFYVANFLTFRNPVWPLFVSTINGTQAYASRMAADYTANLTGPHDPATILFRVGELLTNAAVFPLAAVLILVLLLSLRSHEDGPRRVGLFGLLFLGAWVAMQPRLYPRNILLLLSLGPLLVVTALVRRSLRDKQARLIHHTLVTGIVAMLAASGVLVRDYLRYDLTANAAEFHRFTWYYPVFDWVNRNTPPTARFLVITYSGHSYYLDRPYRRADPWLSGVVDWSAVDSPAKLKSILDSGRYDYVIYDDRDWSQFNGGAAMASSVRSAIAQGILKPVHESKERLYTSRVTRVFSVSNVYVLKVTREPVAPLQTRASLSAPLSAL